MKRWGIPDKISINAERGVDLLAPVLGREAGVTVHFKVDTIDAHALRKRCVTLGISRGDGAGAIAETQTSGRLSAEDWAARRSPKALRAAWRTRRTSPASAITDQKPASSDFRST